VSEQLSSAPKSALASMSLSLWVLCALSSTSCSVTPADPRTADAVLERPLPNETGVDAFGRRYDFDAWLAAHDKSLPDVSIVLSLSGGGAHAAALSRSVIERLAQYEVVGNTVIDHNVSRPRTLADNVILISATSGGSMTAAAFVLDGIGGLDEQTSGFESKVLRHDLLGMVEFGLVYPPFSSDRSARFEDFIKDAFPGDRTFVDLRGNGHGGLTPFLIFNTTDIATGRSLPLVQERMSDLCTDLDKLRISTAVTAASAFPFLLTNIIIKNHYVDHSCPDDPANVDVLPMADSIEAEYADPVAANEARYRATMIRAAEGAKQRRKVRKVQYLHLSDGGLADNLGLRAILRELTKPEILARLGDGGTKSLLLIQVNARSDPIPTSYNESAAAPVWLPQLAEDVSYGPIDRITELSAALIYRYLQPVFDRPVDETRHFPTKTYSVVINLDAEQEESLREDAKAIDTRTVLGESELMTLADEGVRLLSNDPCFRAFLADPRTGVRLRADAPPIPPPAMKPPAARDCGPGTAERPPFLMINRSETVPALLIR
jgi:NTE family protein